MASRAVDPRAAAAGSEQGASRDELVAVAFTALALALVAVVGLASSASPWRTSHAAASASTTASQALAVAGGVVLVIAVMLLWIETPTLRRPRRRRSAPLGDALEERRASLWTATKTMAIVLLGFALFFIATLPLYAPSTPSQRGTDSAPSTPELPSLPGHRGLAGSVDLGWLLLPMGVTFALLTPVAMVLRRRKLRHDAADTDDAGELGRAVRASIAELESERDPRRAILRAYGRMEQAFQSVEIFRGRDETASEFLTRTMRRVPVSADAAAELTDRFEEARFSTHEITENHRGEALASLRRVERELEGRT